MNRIESNQSCLHGTEIVFCWNWSSTSLDENLVNGHRCAHVEIFAVIFFVLGVRYEETLRSSAIHQSESVTHWKQDNQRPTMKLRLLKSQLLLFSLLWVPSHCQNETAVPTEGSATDERRTYHLVISFPDTLVKEEVDQKSRRLNPCKSTLPKWCWRCSMSRPPRSFPPSRSKRN